MAGGETLRELAEFLIALSTMFDGFRERYNEVRQLLGSEQVAFNLVTSPHHNQRSPMIRFYKELKDGNYRPSAIVVNRLRTIGFGPKDLPEIAKACENALNKTQLENLMDALADETALAQRDKQAIDYVRERLPKLPLIALPELALDAHDLGSLIDLHAAFTDIETPSG